MRYTVLQLNCLNLKAFHSALPDLSSCSHRLLAINHPLTVSASPSESIHPAAAGSIVLVLISFALSIIYPVDSSYPQHRAWGGGVRREGVRCLVLPGLAFVWKFRWDYAQHIFRCPRIDPRRILLLRARIGKEDPDAHRFSTDASLNKHSIGLLMLRVSDPILSSQHLSNRPRYYHLHSTIFTYCIRRNI